MSSNLLRQIQKEIEDIYRINIGINVEDYLITKDLCEILLHKNPNIVYSKKMKGFVFLHQSNDELDLAVYLDKNIISGLGSYHPPHLTGRQLNNFFTATEEISHFVYAVWNALQDRQMTRFEMELQAEVDKYITSMFWCGNFTHDNLPYAIKENLFYNFSFDERLSEEEIGRYRRANKIAHEYCRFLEAAYIKNKDVGRLMKDIRLFYRLPQNRKLDHIREKRLVT